MYPSLEGRSAPQSVVKSGPAVKKKPGYSSPNPAPAPYNPPPPVSTNSSGQYSGGGGRPVSAPAPMQGAIMGQGRPANQAPNSRGGGGAAAASNAKAANNVEQKKAALIEQRKAKQNKQHQEEVKSYNTAQQAYLEAQKANAGKANQFNNYVNSDSTYQEQTGMLDKELQDYMVSHEDQKRRVTEDYGKAQERMGQERTTAIERMKNDFAARGLLNSSEFSGALGEYDKSYNQQIGDLGSSNSRSLSDLLEQLGIYQTSNQNAKQAAMQDAIRRRTETFGDYTPDSAVAPKAPTAPKGTKANNPNNGRTTKGNPHGGRTPADMRPHRGGPQLEGRQPAKPSKKKK